MRSVPYTVIFEHLTQLVELFCEVVDPKRGGTLLEEACHWRGRALRVRDFALLLIHSVCFILLKLLYLCIYVTSWP